MRENQLSNASNPRRDKSLLKKLNLYMLAGKERNVRKPLVANISIAKEIDLVRDCKFLDFELEKMTEIDTKQLLVV